MGEGCVFDSMTIYDGTSTSAPLLRDLCGSSLPGDVVSSGNTMYIRFGTNNVDTYSGFRIQYTAIDGTISFSDKTIQSHHCLMFSFILIDLVTIPNPPFRGVIFNK